MTTLFPQQIDSFSIKTPQEIIRAVHINDLQEATIKIQIFIKALEEVLNNHILNNVSHLASTIKLDNNIDGYNNVQDIVTNTFNQLKQHTELGSTAHSAQTISIESINNLLTTNLQVALQDLKNQIDQIVSSTVTLTIFNTHLNTDISNAHSGQLSGSRIEIGTITNDRIADNTITQAKLNFTTVDPGELQNHINTTIEDAHSGTFPIARLDQIVATQTELFNHTSTTSNTHGTEGYIVGTLNTQTLENKTLISAFEGSKIVLFTEIVNNIEKKLFNKKHIGANQLEIRQKSSLQILATDSTNFTVDDGTFFNNVLNIPNGIEFFHQTTLVSLGTATLVGINDNILMIEIPNFTPIPGDIILNSRLSEPLFAVSSTGAVNIKQLNVENGLQNIQFEDDVLITGSLDVHGPVAIHDTTTITGDIVVSGALISTAMNSNNSTTTITSNSVVVDNTTTFGSDVLISNNVTVLGNQTLSGDLNTLGNVVVDGYLNINKSAAILGSLNVQNLLSSGGPTSIGGGLNVSDNAFFAKDLEVIKDVRIRDRLTVDGYTLFKNSAVIEENLQVFGNTHFFNDAYLTNVQLYSNSLKSALIIEQLGDGYSLYINNSKPNTTPITIDGYGNMSIGSSSPNYKLEVIGDSYFAGNLIIENTLTTTSSTFNLINSTATTVNIGGAATTLSLGASTGETAINNNLSVAGSLSTFGNIVSMGQIGSNINTFSSSDSSLTIDWNNANIQKITLTSNCALSFNNAIAGFSYLLILTQGGGGSNLITWPDIKWKGGSPPILSTTINSVDIISLIYDGSNFYAEAALAFS